MADVETPLPDVSGSARPWIVIRSGDERRWGGEIRRQEIFTRLAEATHATVYEGPQPFRRAVLGGRRARLARFLRVAREPKLHRALVSAEQVPIGLLRALPSWLDPIAVAIYDDGVLQAEALGVQLEPVWAGRIRERLTLNQERFRWMVVPTASFAALAGLDSARVIVGGNGTVTSAVRPGPWPERPAIGLASGAAPGRGIEALIEAARALRSTYPDLRLLLYLVATGEAGQRYLATLRSSVAGDDWVEIGHVPYAELSSALARTTVLTIPTPATTYSDVALPVKLFDSLAAGRPLVVTPRLETAALVGRHGVGVVANGDRPDDLAEALGSLLADPARARAIGNHARVVAEQEFDWPVVGRRIANEILAREGVDPLTAP